MICFVARCILELGIGTQMLQHAQERYGCTVHCAARSVFRKDRNELKHNAPPLTMVVEYDWQEPRTINMHLQLFFVLNRFPIPPEVSRSCKVKLKMVSGPEGIRS